VTASICPGEGRSFVDLSSGIFHRLAEGARETNKRQPPVPLPRRLLTHLRRRARLRTIGHFLIEAIPYSRRLPKANINRVKADVGCGPMADARNSHPANMRVLDGLRRSHTRGFRKSLRTEKDSFNRTTASDPAPHALNVVFIGCSELTAHLGLLKRNVDPINGGEDGNGRNKHWPCADPKRDAESKDHKTQIHGIASELVGTTRNEFSIGHALSREDFMPIRNLLKASMRYAGALRLDHVCLAPRQ
jgi:hypothetical protein